MLLLKEMACFIQEFKISGLPGKRFAFFSSWRCRSVGDVISVEKIGEFRYQLTVKEEEENIETNGRLVPTQYFPTLITQLSRKFLPNSSSWNELVTPEYLVASHLK